MKKPVFEARNIKIRHILNVFWFFVCIIVVRLLYLQVDKKLVFSTLGEKNFMRTEIIPPLRGDIFDCRGVLLAANRPVFDVYWHGGGKALSEHDIKILEKMSEILGIDLVLGPRRLMIENAHRYARRVLIQEDINFQQLCRMSEQCVDAAHVVISNRFKRIYPHAALASHILGYLSRSENTGRTGVEHRFDDLLQGEEGYAMRVINSTGKTLAQKVYKEAKAGADITLTLDLQLQQLAESLFEPEQSGAFILMDPETGAIRVLASCPTFDPNMFLRPISENQWEELTINNPLLNRATCATYPPASIFKVVTFAAGLEEKVIDQSSEIQCLGQTTFCGRKYHCMNRLGHGKLTPKEALAVSCNIPCFYIARKLKIDRLAAYAYRFGLGRKTEFLLPEKDGLVPTTAWKKLAKRERWWTGETLSTCIGQGYLLVTPLQMARMISAIFTGSLVKPRMLDQEVVEKERLEVSAETLSFLRSSMKAAVDEGTGKSLSYLRAFNVYAKTGTAQTCSLDQEKQGKQYLEHAWFSCYFSYKNQKPLTMVVLAENTGSSRFAVKIAANFLKGYRALMESQVTTGAA